MGALVGIVLLWLAKHFNPELEYFSFELLITTIIVTLIGVWSTNELESEWGKDPSKVVVDELIGVWIALLLDSNYLAKPFSGVYSF